MIPISATNRGSKRSKNDFYPTPRYAVDLLLDHLYIPADATILEPCIGSGSISSALADRGFECDWAEISLGRDFLTYDFGKTYDFIITNPPFSLAQEFIDRSLELADYVAMLLPLSFLGSKKRNAWWKAHVPTGIYVLSERPSFTGDGKTDASVYAWIVWDRNEKPTEGFRWLLSDPQRA